MITADQIKHLMPRLISHARWNYNRLPVDPEDLVQEVLVRVLRSTYDPKRGSMYTWMCKIMRNFAIDLHRKSSRAQLISLSFESEEVLGAISYPPVQELYLTLKDEEDKLQKRKEGLRNAIASCPVHTREVCELLYLKGLSQSATSKKLNIPLGTVKSRARCARRQFASVR